MIRGEISEYPYRGVITRVIHGVGDADDTELVVYDGVMDEHMRDWDNGITLKTSQYIISIPLVRDTDGNYVIPHRGDKVRITRYEETFNLTVDNSDPSQLGGVSVYCTRNSW